MNELKILTVCGVGMGSSQFLKMQIDDIVKKNGIEGITTDCGDVITCVATSCDVIFTQPQLVESIQSKVNVPIVTITNYTNKKMVEEALMNFLDTLK